MMVPFHIPTDNGSDRSCGIDQRLYFITLTVHVDYRYMHTKVYFVIKLIITGLSLSSSLYIDGYNVRLDL